MAAPPDAVPPWRDESEIAPIIARAQAGDVAAFNQLVDLFQRAAFAVALRMVGNRDTAADLTQDAFVAAFRGIGRFRGGAFRVWLLRIVTNQCLDYWRAQGRRPTVSLDAMVAPTEVGSEAFPHDALLADDAWDPALFVERRELQAVIGRGLLMLPTDQRITVVLSDVEGLSYDEIAGITGTNLGTVKSRLARGRARLRDYLRGQPELLPHIYRHDQGDDRATPPRKSGSKQ
jgi:RNA polymerase sigma-70 factor, ECF subfamily